MLKIIVKQQHPTTIVRIPIFQHGTLSNSPNIKLENHKNCWLLVVAWRQAMCRQAVHQVLGKNPYFLALARTLKFPYTAI